MPLKIMLSAGEVSGDIHGAHLSSELKKLAPDLKLLGMGGERMREVGVDIRFDITQRGTIGLFEGLPHLPIILYVFSRMKRLLDEEKPNLLVLIDYQGFNMLLAKAAKRKGIPTVYYIAPQEWLWGTEKGVRSVVSTIDKIIPIFEEGARVYRQFGGQVAYVGHPLVDMARPTMGKEEALKFFNLKPDHHRIGLFPGSRLQEIHKLLPIMLEVAQRLHSVLPKTDFLLPLASLNFKNKIQKEIGKKKLCIKVVEGFNYDILNISDLVIASSGTVTLEAAYLGTPVITFYKLSPLTYFIAKYILKVKLKFFSLPNIVAGKKIIPELAQAEANPENIVKEAVDLLKNRERIKRMKEEFGLIREKLGAPGVIRRAAEVILGVAKS